MAVSSVVTMHFIANNSLFLKLYSFKISWFQDNAFHHNSIKIVILNIIVSLSCNINSETFNYIECNYISAAFHQIIHLIESIAYIFHKAINVILGSETWLLTKIIFIKCELDEWETHWERLTKKMDKILYFFK